MATASETRSGWTVGIGGEYAFTNNLSAFVEYNYYDFGSRDLLLSTFGRLRLSTSTKRKSVIKGGLNFRFGWARPGMRDTERATFKASGSPGHPSRGYSVSEQIAAIAIAWRQGRRGATVRAMAPSPSTRCPPPPTSMPRRGGWPGVALRTPLVTSPVLDALTGARVFLKAETLQRTGSFKFRGAYNKLSTHPAGAARRRRGRVLLRQSCPGRCRGGAASGHAGGHRHAVGCAAAEARAHRRARRRGRALRPRARGSRRRSPATSPSSAMPRWCRPTTIRW